MNYLAHVFLSDDEPQRLAGNLMADVLRRAQLETLPPRVQQGIRHHRQIDSFTDRHPVVMRSMRRLNERWGWFSGIIIDIYYDHLLANAWKNFTEVSLREFVNHVYDLIRIQQDELPEDAQLLAQRLIQNDRLFSYIHLDGISYALTKVSERICERMPKRFVQLQHALPELQAQHKPLMEDFLEFFPQLIAFSDGWKNRQLRVNRIEAERNSESR